MPVEAVSGRGGKDRGGMRGFSGTYELRPDHWEGGLFGRQIYEFTNDPSQPLTYEDGNTNLIRPDRHTFTDLGSVPKLLQARLPGWFAKDRYCPAYIFHDDAYARGGWWFAVAGGWEFRKITRKQADQYLWQMCRDLGAGRANAYAIYVGVRMGGWASWLK